MTSFRTRVTLWYCGTLLATSIAMMAGLLVFFYVDLRHSEQEELSHFAEKVRSHLGTASSDTAVPGDFDTVVSNINEKISFVFDKENYNFGYAIFTLSGKLEYEFHRMEANPFSGIISAANEDDLFFERWTSYNDCTFYRWLDAGSFRVLVSCRHYLSFVDDLLLAYAVLLPLLLLLSALLGVVMARKVTGPLKAIERTAKAVEKGSLDVRIPNLGAGVEVDRVIRVLNSAFSELETSFEQIRQFSSDVAHELKTPLTSIRGSMEVALRRERKPEEYQSTIADAIEEIVSITRIIEELLMLARPGAWSEKADFQPLDLSAIVERVVEDLEEVADGEGVSMEVKKDAAPLVSGNAVFLSRLVFNLVHNAIKFSHRDSAIRISLKGDSQNVVFEVTDHGVGMAREDSERIFDRFYRVAPGRKEGHGLGLAIAKWIADLHSATISVDSAPGRGSAFRVTFPVADVTGANQPSDTGFADDLERVNRSDRCLENPSS